MCINWVTSDLFLLPVLYWLLYATAVRGITETTTHDKLFTNEPCQLWSYWTEFHEIFARYTGINCAVNANIEVAISPSVSECQCDENGKFAMAPSLEISKKEVQIDHLHPKCYHSVKRLLLDRLYITSC